MKRAGEVWLINLDPTIGAEVRKTRPVVIVNNDSLGILPLKIVVPVLGWKDKYDRAEWIVRLEPDLENRLRKTSGADAFQVRPVSEVRFVRKWGKVSDADLSRVRLALATVLSIVS